MYYPEIDLAVIGVACLIGALIWIWRANHE